MLTLIEKMEISDATVGHCLVQTHQCRPVSLRCKYSSITNTLISISIIISLLEIQLRIKYQY